MRRLTCIIVLVFVFLFCFVKNYSKSLLFLHIIIIILPSSLLLLYLPSSLFLIRAAKFFPFDNQITCTLILLSQVLPYSPDLAIVTLKFSNFYNYSRMCTYISRFGARSHWWERTCKPCLSVPGIDHSVWSFLISTIYPQSSLFISLSFTAE